MEKFEIRTFNWLDYLIFAVSLLLPFLLGLYFGKDSQRSIITYLFGDKNMPIFPVAWSLIVTTVSATVILGIPTEIYLHGIQYTYCFFYNIIPCIVSTIFLLPVLYKLQLISLFEYLELRFNRAIRLLASVVYTINWVCYIPILIYGPTLAVNQVTGISLNVIPAVVCLVCIIYTALGGLKGVVWADTIQGIMMLISTAAIIILGMYEAGGVSQVIQAGTQGARIEGLNMTFDPTIRSTFWSLSIGQFFLILGHVSSNPATYQRYISLPNQRQAQISAIILILGTTASVAITSIVGLILYAVYKNCDPITTQMVQRPDQLLPMFVMEVSKNLPGIPGLFLAGIFSAALSSMSSGLNTISGTVYRDFVEPLYSVKPSEHKANLIMKSIVFITGLICLGLVYIVDKLGPILQVSYVILGFSNGIMAAIFILGILAPFINGKGVLCGTISSFIIMSWITIGSFIATSKGLIKHPTKPLSTEMCTNLTVITTPSTEIPESNGDVFPLYQLSIFLYGLVAALIILIIAPIVSLLSGCNRKRHIDPSLVSPFVRSCLDQRNVNEYHVVPLRNIQK